MLKLTQNFFALAKSKNICFTKLFSVPTIMIVMVVLVFMTWRDNKQAVPILHPSGAFRTLPSI